MTTVILYGSSDDSAPEDICRGISAAGSITRYDGSCLVSESRQCDFFILNTAEPVTLQIPAGILIFLNRISSVAHFSIPQGLVAVTASENKSALQLLMKSSISTVSCGMASSDTLTLSSVNDSAAVVSLQRSITTLSDKIIEPAEYPVKLTSPISEYGLLAACAVLLLSDSGIPNVL